MRWEKIHPIIRETVDVWLTRRYDWSKTPQKYPKNLSMRLVPPPHIRSTRRSRRTDSKKDLFPSGFASFASANISSSPPSPSSMSPRRLPLASSPASMLTSLCRVASEYRPSPRPMVRR